ncbi:hypothetical protein QTP81_04620 [Alteromonas sp. ASW11-36]|uniref:Bacteriophage N4 adsorption protein A C-terminal domain-containing protein n=1 Tax=Alteromonas arenosi TaxID=3055817 RepID=A0ABT7SUL6_9ALTE|nr:hypothetical protein [Alteromonas sp. ASW11-36]MDM7859884.1 hypothetical protein [Alteromonas sp. ASW11-36]
MRLLINTILALCIACSSVQAQQTELTEYQEFKTYPFIEKAYRLQRQGNYAEALVEVEKALEIAPDYIEFQQLKFQLQLQILSIGELMTLFLNASPEEQSTMAPLLLEVLLAKDQAVAIEQYAVVLARIEGTVKTAAILAVNGRLVGQQRMQDSLLLLNSLTSNAPEVILARFNLAVELQDLGVIIALFEQGGWQPNADAVTRYVDALVTLDRDQQVLDFLTANPQQRAATESFIQRQIAKQDYVMAERGFEILEQHGQLNASMAEQRLQMRLSSDSLALSVADVLQSELNCWQKAELLQQRFGDSQRQTAVDLLQSCTVEPEDETSFATVVLSIMNVAELQQIIPRFSGDSARLKQGLIAKVAAQQDYQTLIELSQHADYRQYLDARTLALAYQHMNRLSDAADLYWRDYQTTQEATSLAQATFLWSAAGEQKRTAEVLGKYITDTSSPLEEILVLRYLGALDAQSQIPQKVITRLFAQSFGIDAVAERLRTQQRCDLSLNYLAQYQLQSSASQLTRALCLQQQGDVQAIAAWQQILADNPASENFQATLFAMMNAQQYTEVLALISRYPQFNDEQTVREVKLQALIQTRQYDAGLTEWQSQVEQYGYRDYPTGIELALQADQPEVANQWVDIWLASGDSLSENDWVLVAQVKGIVGQAEAALNAWKLVLAENPQSTLAQLNLAYATIPVSSEQALLAFEAYVENAPSVDPDIWKQMAYLADNVGDYPKVSDYLDKYYAMLSGEYNVDNQNAWSLHELYQQSQRRWDFSATASHGDGAVLGDVFFIDNNGELADSLPNNGLSARLSYRMFADSKRWHAYGQVNASGPDNSPIDQQSLELGVSYRLLESVNVLASAGGILFSDGDDKFQPFVRLSSDGLNQDEWRNGWRFESSWWERQWYNDILYLLDNKQLFAISRFDLGYVKPLSTSTKQTVKLYGLAQFDYRRQPIAINELAAFDQTSLGAGIQWRLFETPAGQAESASVWTASLEFRHRLSGDLTNDDNGWLVTIAYRY